MRIGSSLAGALVVLAAAAVPTLAPASAAAATTGPTISVDRSVVAPGEPVLVSMKGFEAAVMTVSVCGNLARRGSADCDMASSISEERDRHRDVTLAQLYVRPPPVPCPCLVRASSNQQRELAVASIQITGHPTAPVVGVPSGDLLALALDVARVPGGLGDAVRSSLGGATRFAVTVTVRNLSTETLRKVRLGGSAGNWLADEALSLELPAPGPIEPGQTWRRRLEVEVPAPMLGRYRWEVVATGAGGRVLAEQTAGSLPWALVLVVTVLVADCALMAGRFLRRRRATVTATAPRPAEAVEGVFV